VPVNGTSLQCEQFTVSSAPSGTAALVFHPWGWLGGCMYDPVVTALTQHAVKSGLFRTVIRYNMRGVMGSRGFRAMSSSTDAADAAELLRYAIKTACEEAHDAPAASTGHSQISRQPDSGSTVPFEAPATRRAVLLAYSYGSCVASRVLELCPHSVAAYVSVGFPLGMLSRFALGSHGAWDVMLKHGVQAGVPCLVVMGTRDQFTSLCTVQAMVDDAQSKAEEAPQQQQQQQRGEVELHVLEGADHFLMRRSAQAASNVLQWVVSHLPTSWTSAAPTTT